MSKVSANKRDLGMGFQPYGLFPHMTTRQNLEFGLKLRLYGEPRTEFVAEFVELTNRLAATVGAEVASDSAPVLVVSD